MNEKLLDMRKLGHNTRDKTAIMLRDIVKYQCRVKESEQRGVIAQS